MNLRHVRDKSARWGLTLIDLALNRFAAHQQCTPYAKMTANLSVCKFGLPLVLAHRVSGAENRAERAESEWTELNGDVQHKGP